MYLFSKKGLKYHHLVKKGLEEKVIVYLPVTLWLDYVR